MKREDSNRGGWRRGWHEDADHDYADDDLDVRPYRPAVAPGKVTLTSRLPPRPAQVQARAQAGGAHRPGSATAEAHAVAARGTSGAGQALPHGERIQEAFGRHDLSGVRAHVGGAAAEAAESLGAIAFATGNVVAFRAAPDLHTAAHEAAHVVQQRGGVHLAGGVGQVGDRYEQHADAVADRVVRGESAEALLDELACEPAGTPARALQRRAAPATAAPAVEIFPQALVFPPTAAGSIVGSVQQLMVRNRARTPVTVAQIEALPWPDPSAFTVLQGDTARMVEPGGSTHVTVWFRPRHDGPAFALLRLVGEDGATLAVFSVQGEGRDGNAGDARAHARPSEDEAAGAPAAPVSAEVEKAREAAKAAATGWKNAAAQIIKHIHGEIHGEWLRYYSLVGADNPTISTAALPDVSALRALVETGFANALSQTAVGLGKRALRSGSTGAAVGGAVGGPPGAALGFVVSVLIETGVSLMFPRVSRKDAQAAVERAYQEGKADGLKEMADISLMLQATLPPAEYAATAYLDAQVTRLTKQIEGSRDLAEIAKLRDTAHALTEQTHVGRKSDPRFSRDLHFLWARDQAETPTSPRRGVRKVPWENVTAALGEDDRAYFGKGMLRAQPDLFLVQCLRAWHDAGLPAGEDLRAAITAEIAAVGGDRFGRRRGDPIDDAIAGARASQAVRDRFSGREFVWDAGIAWERVGAVGGWRPPQGGVVSCMLRLGIEVGSCFVESFHWRVRSEDSEERRYESRAPDWGWRWVDPNPRDLALSPHAASAALYREMDAMETRGLPIFQDTDAADNGWLQSTFGSRVALVQVQHDDGRPEPVTVFRAADPLPRSWGRYGHPLMDVHRRLSRFDRERRGDHYLYRAGNTILVLEISDEETGR